MKKNDKYYYCDSNIRRPMKRLKAMCSKTAHVEEDKDLINKRVGVQVWKGVHTQSKPIHTILNGPKDQLKPFKLTLRSFCCY